MIYGITIGICTYNRSDILISTLESIVNFIDSTNLEIIIVDNNSTDFTTKIVQEFSNKYHSYDIRYVFEKKQGLSYARNRLIELSKYDNLLFLDDDAVLCSNIVGEYRKAIEKYPLCYIFGGRVIADNRFVKPKWFKKEFYMLYSILDYGNNVSFFKPKTGPIGANFLIKKHMTNNVKFRTDLGRIGTSLLSGEESVFLEKIGFLPESSCYVGSAVVMHCFSVERYEKKWALERFKQNGISNRIIKERSPVKIIRGFLSEVKQFICSLMTFNMFYIKCRFVSLVSYVVR